MMRNKVVAAPFRQLYGRAELQNTDLRLWIKKVVDAHHPKDVEGVIDALRPTLEQLGIQAKIYLWNAAVNLLAAKSLFQFQGESGLANIVNLNRLKQLLTQNQNTRFGRDHEFAQVLKSGDVVRAFQSQVPVSGYKDYEPYLERMFQGAENQITHEPISYYAVSSGTTGKNKLIPITPSWTQQNLNTVFLMQGVLNSQIPGADLPNRGISLMSIAGNNQKTPGGTPVGNGSSEGLSRMKWMLPLMYTSPVEVFENHHKPTAMFLHAVFGLQDRNLKHITATYATYVLELLKTMDMRHQDILRTFETGKLPPDLQLSPADRKILESQIRISPRRLQELKTEFGRGMTNIGPRVWPNMKYVAGVSTGSFSIYRPELSGYLGHIPWYNGFYGASEGSIAANVSVKNPNDYALLTGMNFFEFVPEDHIQEERPQTVAAHQVVPGKKYEVVVTNPAGLYRYRVGDVVEIKGFYKQTPILAFSYRTGSLLNVAAEKTSEKQTTDAIRQFSLYMAQQGQRVVDFTARPDIQTIPPRYVFYVELSHPEALSPRAAQQAATVLNHELGKANPDLREMQQDNYVGLPVVKFVAPGTFDQMAAFIRNSGTVLNANQVKIPRVLKDNNPLMGIAEKSTVQVGQATL